MATKSYMSGSPNKFQFVQINFVDLFDTTHLHNFCDATLFKCFNILKR